MPFAIIKDPQNDHADGHIKNNPHVDTDITFTKTGTQITGITITGIGRVTTMTLAYDVNGVIDSLVKVITNQ